MPRYYHGSPFPGIEALAPRPGRVIYLTGNRAYALFYIRDPEVAGAVRVRAYESTTAAQRQEIAESMAHSILKNRLLDAATVKARFYERSLPEAWALARANDADAEGYIARWEEEHLRT